MNDFIFDKEEYLERINFDEPISIDFEVLKSIRHAQHRAIPFENFDICLGKDISLEPNTIVQKLVKNKRGGYCFELNGLFFLALKAFGFDARKLLGRVHVTGQPGGRSHQITLVTIDDKRWIVDAGFGAEVPPVPIPLIYNQPISFENQTFQLIQSDLFGFMLQVKHDSQWNNLYSFDLNHVCPADIDHGNYYTSTNPKSFFVQKRIATLPVENGVKILLNMEFKKVINGKEEKVKLEKGQSYMNTLEQEFGIVLDAKYEDLKPLE